jgi:hypothetical protein
VRPTETAGASEGFRYHMDRTTYQLDSEGVADKQLQRQKYAAAVRDWVLKGLSLLPYRSSQAAIRRPPMSWPMFGPKFLT